MNRGGVRLMSEQKQNIHPKISKRPYKPGDDDKIVDLLNLSYSNGWNDIQTKRKDEGKAKLTTVL